jgi:hypothetical protein
MTACQDESDPRSPTLEHIKLGLEKKKLGLEEKKLALEAKKVALEEKKQRIDIYKCHIEACDRNFFSLRDLEWRMALQFLSGYVAIGIGYHQLRPKDGASDLLFWWSVVLAFLLFLAFAFFRVCIHHRLHWWLDRRNAFLERLHEIQPDTKSAQEAPYTPWAPYWYAISVQLFVHALATLTVIVFIIATRTGPFARP